MIFALGGNQNCGKTTLFNQLTGSNQHVGNFPGVTVDKKEGTVRGHSDITIVDLPGIYSLSPYTSEEIVTRDFLINERPDCIINIVDATNIERNLYLSLQLIELNMPMVIALNMMDEVRANGNSIKIRELQKHLGVPLIPIVASKNEGVEDLIEAAIDVAENKKLPERMDFCTGAVHRAIHGIAHLIEDHAQRIQVSPRFASTKLIEGDEPMQKKLKLTDNELDMIEHNVKEMERDLGTDREAALADMRYSFIEQACADTVIKTGESKAHLRSLKIDSVLTHKFFAIPIFIGIMLLMFALTFGIIGKFLSNILDYGIEYVTHITDIALTAYGINPVVHSLIINGVFAGVGSVLSFLPIIVTLFFFLSILEDSGYMARVAFVMDKLLRKIGLSGRSFVPMLIGFGCSVPAIMSTRTLASERDRKMTILLIPFMSCSAKVPIYALLTAAFFAKNQAFVMIVLYIFGICMGILSGYIFNNTIFKGNAVPFVMELPNYRLPSFKSVILLMWDKAKDFLVRAFTIIFVATIVIWFLQTFDTRFNVVSDSSMSMLALIGKVVSPIFTPLGFNDWRVSTALITGFTAKEAVVSTFAVLAGSNSIDVLRSIFTPMQAFSFLIFTLLYTPCVAAISAVRREMNSTAAAIEVIIFQIVMAWLAAFVVYNIGGFILNLF
ncbi:MAG: ferrous iron transport protein B [Clostridia bacterium]|jgi:ferrous iron transport protein B|nr:ferrous iron transport protein B [Clostridia bacterium]MCI2015772.1 ferrous iron transport protein B [Clostridia bacterium]